MPRNNTRNSPPTPSYRRIGDALEDHRRRLMDNDGRGNIASRPTATLDTVDITRTFNGLTVSYDDDPLTGWTAPTTVPNPREWPVEHEVIRTPFGFDIRIPFLRTPDATTLEYYQYEATRELEQVERAYSDVRANVRLPNGIDLTLYLTSHGYRSSFPVAASVNLTYFGVEPMPQTPRPRRNRDGVHIEFGTPQHAPVRPTPAPRDRAAEPHHGGGVTPRRPDPAWRQFPMLLNFGKRASGKTEQLLKDMLTVEDADVYYFSFNVDSLSDARERFKRMKVKQGYTLDQMHTTQGSFTLPFRHGLGMQTFHFKVLTTDELDNMRGRRSAAIFIDNLDRCIERLFSGGTVVSLTWENRYAEEAP
jgi:hypothetical protein